LLGLAAPAGVGFIAGQSLQWAAGETLTLASGQSSNLAVAKDLRIHTGQAIGWLANAVEGASAGNDPVLSVVAGIGKLEFEAQHDQISLQSRDQLKIVSANAEVELAAGKTVHLATAGGASLTIEGGNIVISCPGTITVHAAKKSFVGPAKVDYKLSSLPKPLPHKLKYVVRDYAGNPLKDTEYVLLMADGSIKTGRTNASGETQQVETDGPEKVHLIVDSTEHDGYHLSES
jgi:uncharacterized protein (DUF2345 family)